MQLATMQYIQSHSYPSGGSYAWRSMNAGYAAGRFAFYYKGAV